MPIRIHGKTFMDFEAAARFVARWKKITMAKARAYVAAVDRKQNKKKHGRGK